MHKKCFYNCKDFFVLQLQWFLFLTIAKNVFNNCKVLFCITTTKIFFWTTAKICFVHQLQTTSIFPLFTILDTLWFCRSSIWSRTLEGRGDIEVEMGLYDNIYGGNHSHCPSSLREGCLVHMAYTVNNIETSTARGCYQGC